MRSLIIFFVLCMSHVLSAMTLGIFACPVSNAPTWDPDSIYSGVTGSEEAVIYMSQALARLGYDVVVFGNPPPHSPHAKQGANPLYVSAYAQQAGMLDIAIAWRDPTLAQSLRTRAQKVYLWPHDTCDLPLSDEDIFAFDDVLWLSSWQREAWVKVNPGFAKFKRIFANGVNLEQFEPVRQRDNPYACIYASNYGRGLEVLLDVWPKVKKKYPQATLDIYYGWNHWGLLSPQAEKKLREQIVKLEKLDVVEHGLVSHQELNAAYARASLWTYPCTADETFCITALRAQRSGAIPVVIKRSALQETVRGGYSCYDQDSYLQTLLTAMAHAPHITLAERANLGNFIAYEYTWQSIAERWHKDFHRKTICLNMIVKDESQVIERCLNSVKDMIDQWVIVDTGSTDGTQALIKKTLKGIPGTLYERPWVDFEHNRQEALMMAKGRGNYILLIDADEYLEFAAPCDTAQLDKDLYQGFVRERLTCSYRPLLIKDTVAWTWKGRVHERIIGPPNYTQAVMPQVVNVSITADGRRSQNPHKYLEDALVLEQMVQEDPQDVCYWYFLGQSYAHAGEYEKAITAFEQCAQRAKHPEVIWFCHYVCIRLRDQGQEDPALMIEAYSKNFMERPIRLEPLYCAMQHAFRNQDYILAYAMAKFALTLPLPLQDVNTHIEHWMYDYGLLCMYADAALNVGQIQEAHTAYLELLKRKSLPEDVQHEIVQLVTKIESLKAA